MQFALSSATVYSARSKAHKFKTFDYHVIVIAIDIDHGDITGSLVGLGCFVKNDQFPIRWTVPNR